MGAKRSVLTQVGPERARYSSGQNLWTGGTASARQGPPAPGAADGWLPGCCVPAGAVRPAGATGAAGATGWPGAFCADTWTGWPGAATGARAGSGFEPEPAGVVLAPAALQAAVSTNADAARIARLIR